MSLAYSNLRNICAQKKRHAQGVMKQTAMQNCRGGSRIFLKGVTLGTRASEASEHWEGLGLRENEIWTFAS